MVTVLCFTAIMVVASSENGSASERKVKNVIVMIPDGCGSTHTTLARWYSGESLALDQMPSGLVRTYAGESIIVDSAPAATAFATGIKTSDKYVGVMPGPVTIPGVDVPSADQQYMPVANVLEAAKAKGMSVGLVATSTIQHATPAGFSAHWPDRANYNEIAEQQVYLDIDVVFGGGSQYLVPTTEGGKRTDGENLIDVLEGRGYAYIDTRSELASLDPNTKKVWGLFAADAMAHDFDRQQLAKFQEEPSLAEMTQAAISILSKNPRGFILMVEGSQVDWSSHANDPIGVISEVLAFDAAVEVALKYAKHDRKTMVLGMTDHGNAGMSIGNKNSDATYSKTSLETLLKPLMGAKLTGYGMAEVLSPAMTDAEIRAAVAEYYGITDLTDAEVNTIRTKYNPGSMDYVLGPMLSARSIIGWTTSGHTGEDVTLYSYGPNRPVGLLENTDIAHVIEASLGLNLEWTSDRTFMEASAAFAAIGATVKIDSTDPNNKVLVVEKAGKPTMYLPLSKDIAEINGKVYNLNGVTITSPKSGKTYVSQDALLLFAGKGMCYGMTGYATWDGLNLASA